MVNSHMTVMDMDRNQEDIIFDKNIMHFKLMKKEEAIRIYREIIKQHKQQFPRLSEWIDNELR